MVHRHGMAEQVLRMPFQEPPPPWKMDWVAVAGLTEVGYAPDSDLLLAISENRGVFDCSFGTTQRKVARDKDTQGWLEGWRDSKNLTAIGIGPIEGQTVRLAGMFGGGMKLTSPDHWSLVLASPNWPLSSIILCPPNCSLFHRGSEHCVKVSPRGAEDDIIAYGFSQTGKSFIVAMSHTIEIFSRP